MTTTNHPRRRLVLPAQAGGTNGPATQAPEKNPAATAAPCHPEKALSPG